MDAEELWSIIFYTDFRRSNKEDRDKVLAFSKKEAVSLLCQLSLERKWYKDSPIDIHDLCPFCKHLCLLRNETWSDFEGCQGCYCPPEICADLASEGIIATIEEDYVAELSAAELTRIQDLFKRYV